MQASALQRTRYKELSPSAECGDFAFIDRLEHDHIEDGRWANPLTTRPASRCFRRPTAGTRIRGRDRARMGLLPCTTPVCKTMPECCGAGPSPEWGALAGTRRLQSARRAESVRRPVWPRDRQRPEGLAEYLFGPGARCAGRRASGMGFVADGVGLGLRPGVAGRHRRRCHPRRRPREPGEPRWRVHADKALAPPLSLEVSAACDGARRAYARHGFSFAPPEDLPARLRLRARPRDRRRSGGAADADQQRHRPCSPLRAQRTRGGRGARRRM